MDQKKQEKYGQLGFWIHGFLVIFLVDLLDGACPTPNCQQELPSVDSLEKHLKSSCVIREQEKVSSDVAAGYVYEVFLPMDNFELGEVIHLKDYNIPETVSNGKGKCSCPFGVRNPDQCKKTMYPESMMFHIQVHGYGKESNGVQYDPPGDKEFIFPFDLNGFYRGQYLPLSKGGQKFKCVVDGCTKKVKAKSQLLVHIFKYHKPINYFYGLPVSIGNFQTGQTIDVRQFLKGNESQIIFQCSECNLSITAKTSVQEAFDKHFTVTHFSMRYIELLYDFYGYKAGDKIVVQAVLRKDGLPYFLCPVPTCDEEPGTYEALLGHLKEHRYEHSSSIMTVRDRDFEMTHAGEYNTENSNRPKFNVNRENLSNVMEMLFGKIRRRPCYCHWTMQCWAHITFSFQRKSKGAIWL